MLLRWKTQDCDTTIQMLQQKLWDRTRPDRAQCLFQAFPVHSGWDCAEFSLGVSLFAERSENRGFCDARARLLGTATIQCCNALPHLPFSFWCSCATAWPSPKYIALLLHWWGLLVTLKTLLSFQSQAVSLIPCLSPLSVHIAFCSRHWRRDFYLCEIQPIR